MKMKKRTVYFFNIANSQHENLTNSAMDINAFSFHDGIPYGTYQTGV